MPNESPYTADKLGPAFLVTMLIFICVAAVGLALWGLVALFLTHPVAAFVLVSTVVLFVAVIFLVQYLDAKYEWGLLVNW